MCFKWKHAVLFIEDTRAREREECECNGNIFPCNTKDTNEEILDILNFRYLLNINCYKYEKVHVFYIISTIIWHKIKKLIYVYPAIFSHFIFILTYIKKLFVILLCLCSITNQLIFSVVYVFNSEPERN